MQIFKIICHLWRRRNFINFQKKGHISDNPSMSSWEILGSTMNIVPSALYEKECEMWTWFRVHLPILSFWLKKTKIICIPFGSHLFHDVLYHFTTLNPLHRSPSDNTTIISMHAPLLVSMNVSFQKKLGHWVVFLNIHLNSWARIYWAHYIPVN